MKPVIIVFLTLLFFSCEKTIDASSEEAYTASLDAIKSSMTPEMQDSLKNAIAFIGMDGLSLTSLLEVGESNDATPVLKIFDGMTANDIFVEAERLKAEKLAKEKAEAKKELAELEDKKLRAEADMTELAKFKFTDTKFYRRKDYFMTTAVLKMTVENGLDVPVKKVRFSAKLASEGRAVPWVDAPVGYEIPGGLEPGEKATWILEPNIMSDWYNAESRRDAKLTLQAIEIIGVDDEVLYSSEIFGKEEKDRLNEILKKFPELSN